MLDSEAKNGQVTTVSLREIIKKTVRSILDLKVAKGQEKFVASNARSIAEAWFRAIYVDETPVGFVMISDIPEKAEYCTFSRI